MTLEASKTNFNPVYCQHGKIFYECKEGCNKLTLADARGRYKPLVTRPEKLKYKCKTNEEGHWQATFFCAGYIDARNAAKGSVCCGGCKLFRPNFCKE